MVVVEVVDVDEVCGTGGQGHSSKIGGLRGPLTHSWDGVISEGEGGSIPSTMLYYIYLGAEIDNQGRAPMNNFKDCRVGQLSSQYKDDYHDSGNHAN